LMIPLEKSDKSSTLWFQTSKPSYRVNRFQRDWRSTACFLDSRMWNL
jgi:hypothetical protein